MTCYGDPHIITYGTEESVTCPALGNKTYIDNAFFTLHGYASEPYPGTGASYVYEVRVLPLVLMLFLCITSCHKKLSLSQHPRWAWMPVPKKEALLSLWGIWVQAASLPMTHVAGKG